MIVRASGRALPRAGRRFAAFQALHHQLTRDIPTNIVITFVSTVIMCEDWLRQRRLEHDPRPDSRCGVYLNVYFWRALNGMVVAPNRLEASRRKDSRRDSHKANRG